MVGGGLDLMFLRFLFMRTENERGREKPFASTSKETVTQDSQGYGSHSHIHIVQLCNVHHSNRPFYTAFSTDT